MDIEKLGRNVEARMLAKGMHAKGLSLAAGVNAAYVRDILKGRSRNPRTGHLAQIAAALGCTLGDLTGEVAGMAEGTASWSGSSIEADTDDDFAELSAAVEAMLAEEQMPTDTRTVAKLTRELWREITTLPRAMSFADRMALTISARRSIVKHARTAIFQRVR